MVKNAEALVKRMAAKTIGGHPASLTGLVRAIVLYNNLSSIPRTT